MMYATGKREKLEEIGESSQISTGAIQAAFNQQGSCE